MGRLRRSRRWTAALSIAALLAVVASSSAALAEGDPPTPTDAPATDAPATTDAAPPAGEPATTTETPPGDGGDPGTDGNAAADAETSSDSPTTSAAAAGGGLGGAPEGSGGPTITQVGDADLAVSKTDAPDPVTAGSNITYTITAVNNGPDPAVNARIQDQVTGVVTFVSLSQNSGPTAGCNFPAVGSPGTVNCFIDPFAPGATAVFTLVVNVNPTTPTGQQVLNPVSIDSFETPDPDPTNNAEIETTTVQALQADLAVSKADSPDPVTPGSNITYTIAATNNGPNAASSVSLQDAIPFNTTFVSLAAPPGWSCTTPMVGSTGSVSCSIASFASGGSATFTLVVKVSPSAPNGSTISNNTLINNQGTQDPNFTNNIGSAQTLVESADLAVTKTDSPDRVPSGTNLTYTITVTNNGGATAQNVTMSDTVPANTTFVSLNAPAGWTCTTPPPEGTGTVSCTIGSLANGASATFTLVVHVDAGTADGTVITNTANAGATTGDANTGNNSATATSTVGPSADLAVTKTAPASVPFESNLSYSITVTNNGPSPAENASLTDVLPAGTTFVSLAAPAGWSCTTPAVGGTGTVQCGIDPLPAAAPATFTLVVHAVAPSPATINNTASVASTTAATAIVATPRFTG
jgi:uncharacterized repeat protein (TIGR01451 family)